MATVLIRKVSPVDKTGVCSQSNSIKQGYAVMLAMSCPRVQGQPPRADSSHGARAFLSHSKYSTLTGMFCLLNLLPFFFRRGEESLGQAQ